MSSDTELGGRELVALTIGGVTPPPTLEYTKQTCQQTQEAGAKHAL